MNFAMGFYNFQMSVSINSCDENLESGITYVNHILLDTLKTEQRTFVHAKISLLICVTIAVVC